MKVVFTGTGRCGTGFVAKVLSEAGCFCTHEGVYGPNGPAGGPIPPAESSWMAVPHLGRIDTPKVLVFREPVAVVRSLLGIRFFETPGPYLDFALRHEPRLAKMSPVNAAWLWWSAWNERALPHVDATFRVDRPAWERVASFTDIPVRDLARAAMTVGDGYNSRVWADLVDVFDGVDTKLIERAGELYLNLRR